MLKLAFYDVYSLWFSHRLFANPSWYIHINSVWKLSALFNNSVGNCCLHSFYFIFFNLLSLQRHHPFPENHSKISAPWIASLVTFSHVCLCMWLMCMPAAYICICQNFSNMPLCSIRLCTIGLHYYRAMLYMSAVFAWPGVRPSICLSRSCILSRPLKISSHFFLGPIASSFYFWPPAMVPVPNSKRNPFSRAQNTKGGKILWF